MKKSLVLLGIIISSFFFSSSFVKADTYTIAIPDSILTIVEDNIDTMIATADDILYNYHLNDNSQFDGYWILHNSNSNGYWAYFYQNIATGAVSYERTSGPINIAWNKTGVSWTYSSDFSTLTWGSGTSYYTTDIFNFRYVLYAKNVSIKWNSNYTNTVIFTNGSNSYTVDTSSGDILPTIYDFYQMWYASSSSILDNFVSLVLEKLVAITDFISSNDIYLTMFVIFILYFVILLFRRLK